MNDVNQCDGCKRGLPIEQGLHMNNDGRPYMGCTKSKYISHNERPFLINIKIIAIFWIFDMLAALADVLVGVISLSTLTWYNHGGI